MRLQAATCWTPPAPESSKIVSKKGYDAEKPKPELPGTQRQIDVPYPQVPRKDARSKKAGQKKQIEIKEQTAVPIESETGKNQMVQTESVQTKGNLQVRQSSEDTISAKKALLSQVMSVHADGSKKVVNNYIQISGKQTLKEIVEYDEKGRIILIQNPETQVEKKFGYFPDGKKKLQEEYKNGKPHGNWIRWNKKGEILSNRIYKKGKLKKKIKKNLKKTVIKKKIPLAGFDIDSDPGSDLYCFPIQKTIAAGMDQRKQFVPGFKSRLERPKRSRIFDSVNQ